MPKTDATPGICVEELDRLARQVDQWFRRATSRFKAPSDHACGSVAIYLLAFRDDDEDKKPDRRNKAIRYGRLFLKHIKTDRRHVEMMISAASRGTPFGDWLQRYQDMMWRIDEIQRHMAALLPALSAEQGVKPDVVRKLASVAQEAWAAANSGRYPRSTNPDDPLCQFLVKALAAIGQAPRAATISEVLRGRRRTPRKDKFSD